MPYERTLPEILSAHGDSIRNEMRKCIPATVTGVHPERQTCDVQIALQNPLLDQYGQVTYEQLPALSDVPVGFMRGGGFFVYVPVAVGDSLLLVFSDLSVDTWRAAPSGGPPVEPGWAGKHTADSPFAIPCIAPDAKVFADPATDPNKVIIGKDGSTAQIRLSATDIELGRAATDFVALASKVDAAMNTIVTAMNGHTHTAPSGGGPTTPPIAGVAGLPITVSGTGSALVKSS